ncbi:MAG: hypothetical protein Ct9H300mP16_18000 [Pseudomonadota bacterium]|nr:MAG: hypothetical protein Ct9H300mP16_18000 [Pseudomonadota bacterium]
MPSLPVISVRWCNRCVRLSVEQPRQWHYPAGYCTLGCGLPNGIGGKIALDDTPVVVLAGRRLYVHGTGTDHAAEMRLSLPIISGTMPDSNRSGTTWPPQIPLWVSMV